MPEDPIVKSLVDKFQKEMDIHVNNQIAYSEVNLYGGRPKCRLQECAFGSFMADAMASSLNSSAALLNSGSIKGSLQGHITTGDILLALPFSNTIDLIEIKGSTLRKILEKSFDNYDPNHPDPPGYFLQVSGLYIVVDLALPLMHRITSLRIGPDSKTAKMVKVDELYKVAVPGFLVKGGDGYSMIPAELISHQNLGLLDKDLLTSYIHKRSPIKKMPSRGRIIIESLDASSNASRVEFTVFFTASLLLFYLIYHSFSL